MYVKPKLERFGSVRELTKLAYWWWWWCEDEEGGPPDNDPQHDRS